MVSKFLSNSPVIVNSLFAGMALVQPIGKYTSKHRRDFPYSDLLFV